MLQARLHSYKLVKFMLWLGTLAGLILGPGVNVMAQQNRQVYEGAIDAVAWIINNDSGIRGSGILVRKRPNILVTNAHVVEESN